MDYKIKTKESELDSTGYMEIGPGKYSGKHWQNGFLFVWSDAFGMAEGIVMRHFKEYDHFEMNDIPKDVGMKIMSEWFSAASKLKTADENEYRNILNLDAVYGRDMKSEIKENREAIIKLLDALGNAFDRFFQTEEWVCILGM